MAMGFGFVCGIFDPGIVRCAGSNKFGQLGDGTKVTRANVADVPGLFTVVRLIAGAAHACALNTYGEVYCWGANDSGQLGDGTTTDRSSPGLVQF
jgi:alpha-tubulin suppressor-like RCC1 family protein